MKVSLHSNECRPGQIRHLRFQNLGEGCAVACSDRDDTYRFMAIRETVHVIRITREDERRPATNRLRHDQRINRVGSTRSAQKLAGPTSKAKTDEGNKNRT